MLRRGWRRSLTARRRALGAGGVDSRDAAAADGRTDDEAIERTIVDMELHRSESDPEIA
jgi:hypothetical protein